jgi:soluble lytic murein transglycosylase-like protein
MRVLFAANALAAALLLVPIGAKLEPLASAIETADANAFSPAAAELSGSRQDALDTDALGTFAAALNAWFSAEGHDSKGGPNAASMPPESGAPAGASADSICAALDRSASQNKLPLDFFTRLIWQESRFNPLSISHAGAQGIAQFMPGTARRVGLLDPFDPIEALPKSAELLRDLRAQFGNLGLAAAAYNAGPKRVEDWLAKRKGLPQETEAYVRIITGRAAQEWTGAEAAAWDVAVPAPAPCVQLAKSAPHRPPLVIAAHPPDRPVHPVPAAHQPERPVTVAHEESVRRLPAHGLKLAHSQSGVADRESVRCCRLPPHGAKLAHSESGAADRESLRCCHVAAHGVKLARLESSIAAPKSVTAAPKSGHARPHLIGSSSARDSTAETARALRRVQPAAPHRKPGPSTHAARVA